MIKKNILEEVKREGGDSNLEKIYCLSECFLLNNQACGLITLNDFLPPNNLFSSNLYFSPTSLCLAVIIGIIINIICFYFFF